MGSIKLGLSFLVPACYHAFAWPQKGWMVLCVGSRLMEQPALLRLLTLYMFGRIPCSSLIMVDEFNPRS